MNLGRFLRKLATDPPAARKSVKLISRAVYGKLYWKLRPNSPLKVRLSSGGILLLNRGHSFTECIWPMPENYEPDVCCALKRLLRTGDVFIDCGANVGYFSVIAGSIVGPSGRVIAIEANPTTFALLERNLQANGFGTAINLALAANEGEVELFVPPAGDIFSTVRTGGMVASSTAEVTKVKSQTLPAILSSLAVERADVIKIDIEGGELEVLESSCDLLKTQRPTVICEYGTSTWPAFGATVDRLQKLLDACRYTAGTFDIRRQTFVPVTTSVWESLYANLVLKPIDAKR
jgi:FkbM family methyltransferase